MTIEEAIRQFGPGVTRAELDDYERQMAGKYKEMGVGPYGGINTQTLEERPTNMKGAQRFEGHWERTSQGLKFIKDKTWYEE